MGGLNPGSRLALEKPLLRGSGTGWAVTVASTTGRLAPVAKAMHSWQVLQPLQNGLAGIDAEFLALSVALSIPSCAACPVPFARHGQSHGVLDAGFASE